MYSFAVTFQQVREPTPLEARGYELLRTFPVTARLMLSPLGISRTPFLINNREVPPGTNDGHIVGFGAKGQSKMRRDLAVCCLPLTIKVILGSESSEFFSVSHSNER